MRDEKPDEISAADWGQTPPTVQAYIKQLSQRLGQVESQVAGLEERLGQHSGNSSRPPSLDEPGQKPSKGRGTKGGGKRGGQRGHKRVERL
jgi:hypothetical protein